MKTVRRVYRPGRRNIITLKNALFLLRERATLATALSSVRIAIYQLQIAEPALSRSLIDFDLNISASNAKHARSPAAKTARSRGK